MVIPSNLIGLQGELREVHLFISMEIWCVITSYLHYSVLNLLPCLFLSMTWEERMANTPHVLSPGHTFSKGA